MDERHPRVMFARFRIEQKPCFIEEQGFCRRGAIARKRGFSDQASVSLQYCTHFACLRC